MNVMHAQVPGPQTPPRDEVILNGFDGSAGALTGDSAPNEAADPQPTITSGQVHVGQKSTTYIGATHWAAILDDIEEVKDYFDETEDDELEEETPPAVDLLFNIDSLTTKSELLATLPPRKTVDQLVARYFNSSNAALRESASVPEKREYTNFRGKTSFIVLHFRKRFWADPHHTSTCWLGLLYGLMALASFGVHITGDENPDPRAPPLEMTQTYRRCCIQCLRLSDYTKPGKYTIETILAHMEGEFALSGDEQVACYLLLGVALRIALRMGLHRDPDKIGGGITPYQGEMRRRLWHMLKQIEMLASFHIGLPSMVESIESDTQLPRNLNDTDFSEDSTELPPARGPTEITTTSYLICKSRIGAVFGKIATHANSLSMSSYDEVLRLDKELVEAHSNVPPIFQTQPLELSITDTPQLILFRFNIGHLFHKSRCVLHRKYLVGMEDQGSYEFSVKAGLEAAIQLLYCQSQIFEASQPGGPLSRDRCFPSSLLMHDYLLASMIVYMRTMKVLEAEAKGMHATPEVEQQKTESIAALRRAAEVWNLTFSKFADVKRAADVLNSMLNKLNSALERLEAPKVSALDRIEDWTTGSVAGLSLNGKLASWVFDWFSFYEVLPNGFADDPHFGMHTDNYLDGLGPEMDSSNFVQPSGNDSYLLSTFSYTSNTDTTAVPQCDFNQIEPLESLMDLPPEFDWVCYLKLANFNEAN
ncbi:fungal specific transcription factor domain-containing protein [Rutstroemia sp. NJR-2017a BVV2]|nr:fungal specific transcription factor domain-containing protein [Rutstroemia sp. NJR-2017a BVV2]